MEAGAAERIAGVPLWLHDLSIASVSLGFLSALILLFLVVRDPQHMGVMNVVWPVAGLFGTVATLWLYLRWGRLAAHDRVEDAMIRDEPMPNMALTPFPAMVAKGAAHCGAACMLADIAAEWIVFAFPAVAVALGWGGLYHHEIFARWIADYLLALGFGIVFQYFAIAPMRGLGPMRGLAVAARADVASLTAWQIGMYGWMALAHFYLWRHLLGADLEVDSWEFWFMMQAGMMAGFLTAYPVNWWLISAGVKERM